MEARVAAACRRYVDDSIGVEEWERRLDCIIRGIGCDRR